MTKNGAKTPSFLKDVSRRSRYRSSQDGDANPQEDVRETVTSNPPTADLPQSSNPPSGVPARTMAPSKPRKLLAKKPRYEPDPISGLTPNESFDHISREAMDKWPIFRSRPFTMGRPVHLGDFEPYGLPALFDALHLSYALSITQVAYPELVRIFYSNLQRKSKSLLTSRVRGIDIELTPSVLVEIFKISASGENPMDLQYPEAMSRARAIPSANYNSEICRERMVQTNYTKTNQLNERAQLIVKIIVWNLAPKAGSLTSINTITKILLLFIWKQHDFNFAQFMLDFMISQAESENALPYGMWLTSIFKHFSIDIEQEESAPAKTPIEGTTAVRMHLETSRAAPLDDDAAGTSAAQEPVPPSSAAANTDVLARIAGLETETQRLRMDVSRMREDVQTQFAIIHNDNANTSRSLNSMSQSLDLIMARLSSNLPPQSFSFGTSFGMPSAGTSAQGMGGGAGSHDPGASMGGGIGGNTDGPFVGDLNDPNLW